MRAHMRMRTDFGRIQLIWQNLAEVDQAGRIRQNSIDLAEFGRIWSKRRNSSVECFTETFLL